MLTKKLKHKGLCVKFRKVLIERELVKYKTLMKNYGGIEKDCDL